MEILSTLKHYVNYQWKAKTKYYLHSPFVYNLFLNVMEGNDGKTNAILPLRNTLSKNNTTVSVTDFGTGGATHVKLSNIERNVAVPHKYGQLLYNLCSYFKPNHIIEIGGSIGISSCYMALAVPQANIISLEGSIALSEVARKNYDQLGIKNIEVINGEFKHTLPQLLENLPSIGLVFFDGNHTKMATLQYFHACLERVNENSIFVFDDIYWSDEMIEAWNEIKAHPRVTLTIDVFKMGICFFRKEKLAKETFMLRY